MPEKIEVLSREVRLAGVNEQDYLCLTDIARYKDPERTDYLIFNWLRNRNTIEFLGLWEQINNPGFNPIEFDGIKKQAGLNSFILTAKQWIERTGAIGIQSKAGRYGGTYAHSDIAFEFASWISVEFKLYLIKEFQRLKETERQTLGWDIRRNLAKINYRIHTDRCHSDSPDSARAQQGADERHLCQRGGRAEHGPVRQDGSVLAGRESGREGQHSRSGNRCSARLSFEPRKPQRAVYLARDGAARATWRTQSDCDSADATADGG
jgi:hypothetical protein